MRAVKGLVVVLALCAVFKGGEISYDAFRAADYSGMITLLQRFESVLAPDDIVVADDPRWGTPLLSVLGLDVINGRAIWKKPDGEEKRASAKAILEVGARMGRRVVWVTSTGDGLTIYGEGLGGRLGQEIGDAISFVYPTVIHSPRATVYVNRENQKTFRFWVLDD